MATAAREEKQKQKQPYEGLGAGGKFRKTPFRRATPYDRPSTALRNPSTANTGWISKLVDPAQRLITYSAHRLFSTVFNKRLPPPSTVTLPEAYHEAKIKDKAEVGMDPPVVQKGAIDKNAGPSTTSDRDGFTLLEQILEQKTFSRHEIDRLKELLHSRTVDISIENEEKRSEVIPSKEVVSHDVKEEFGKTPLQDKSGINSHLVSTPVVSTSVLDEDVASPAELAKAYMGSRPSKVSPSMLGLRSQALHEDSHILSSVPFPSKSPLMSVPRISGNGAVTENGFATPRSRGRSAIHSMARTPYSRVQTSSTFKGVGSTVDTYGGPSSSSQSIWEQIQPSGSKQGVLKRRFSVLDNDIGSVGPIRRIRPKPNLLSSRGLNSPISSSTVSIHGTRISSGASQNPSSSTKRPLLLGEPEHTLANALSENGDNAVCSTSFSTIPSQSSKAASKIFEHLDKIISPKEKSSGPKLLAVRDRSPTKLSPSMLHGQALKSLEDVNSSKFFENVCYKNSNSLDVSSNLLIPDATSQKNDKVEEDGPSRIVAPCDSSTSVANGVDSITEKKDVVPKVKAAVSAASNAVAHPPEKKRAFKMSAHEYLELDDEDYSNNGLESGSSADGRVKMDKNAPIKPEKPPALSEVKPPASLAINQKADCRVSDDVYTVAIGATNSSKAVESNKPHDKSNSDAEVPFRVPETAVSSSSSSAAATTGIFSTVTPVSNNLASQNFSGTMSLTGNTINNIATSSAVNTSSSNLFSSVSAPPFSAEPSCKFAVSTASTAVMQVPANSSLESIGDKNMRDGGFANLSGTSFTGTSATSAGTGLSFAGVSAAASTPSATNQLGSTLSAGSGSGPSTQASPELSFPFVPSIASNAVTAGNFSVESLNDKNKQGGIFGNGNIASLSGTSATSAGAASNSLGFSAAASTPTTTNQSLGSAVFGGPSGTGSSAQVSPAGTGVASFTQSAPVQLGSSASGLEFGFSGNTAFSSGSSALGSSTPSSEANPISSSTTPSPLFGTGWQPTTSSKFASTINSASFSPVFQFGASPTSAATKATPTSFGASSASVATSNSVATVFGMPSVSAPTTNSIPLSFGASTVSTPSTNSASVFGLSNGASPTPIFSFVSSATTTAPSQPAFGNSDPFAFPTAPSGNNDQMSMEDSMAEDTVHASPITVPLFGQQPVSTLQSAPAVSVFGQQPVSTPQSPFAFGGPNTFQFPSQPNAANPQNPSPFQASSSLGLSTGGGSFSLGSGNDKSNRRFVKVQRNKPRKK